MLTNNSLEETAMSLKSVAFAALGMLCLTDVALAQDASAPPTEPIDAAQLLKSRSAVSQAAGVIGGSGILPSGSTNGATPSLVSGWNYFHAYNCQWYYDGTNNWLYVFSPEGLYFYVPNNDYAAKTFLTGCVNGYWEAVYVTNTSTGAFNRIQTYYYK
jgi:hypothetical protein